MSVGALIDWAKRTTANSYATCRNVTKNAIDQTDKYGVKIPFIAGALSGTVAKIAPGFGMNPMDNFGLGFIAYLTKKTAEKILRDHIVVGNPNIKTLAEYTACALGASIAKKAFNLEGPTTYTTLTSCLSVFVGIKLAEYIKL